ncbi:hypothetical protein M8J77_003632 [Diaphorina citri]|nr:hypothetical protein M8J77_003632 [Diaphorina citri]
MAKGSDELVAEMEMELKVLVLKKEYIFASVQAVFDLCKNLKDPSNLSSFKKKLALIDGHREEFSRLVERINLLEVKINPKSKPTGFTPVQTLEEMVGVIKHYEFVINKPPEPTAPALASTSTNQGTFHLKLQPLELPSFNGTLEDWPLFYEVFKANVHNREDLSKSHKLQYLLSKLTGRALSVCAGIAPTENNYDIIFQGLVDKYNDKRSLASHYLDVLFNYKPRKQESGYHLGCFVDKFGATVAALRALQLESLEEFFLFYLANSKLDCETQRLFESSLDRSEIPKFSKLLEFVSNQTKILSRINGLPGSGGKYDSYDSKNSKKVNHSFVVKNSSKCCRCHKEHALYKCEDFLTLSPRDRYVFAKQQALCINCLGGAHKVNECTFKSSCAVCKLKHNTLLHFNVESKVGEMPMVSNESTNNVKPNSNLSLSLCSGNVEQAESTVLLSTVKILVVDNNGSTQEMRFLLDSASMCNIISNSACKQLGLKVHEANSNLRGIGSNASTVNGQVNFRFLSKLDNRVNFTVNALVVDCVVDKLPTQVIDCTKLNYLHGIPLADDTFMIPGNVSGILGAQIYPYLLNQDSLCGSGDQPMAWSTKLGYVVMGTAPVLNNYSSGEYQLDSDSCDNVNNTHCMFQLTSLDHQLTKFWELDNIIPTKDVNLSPDDKICEEIYVKNLKRDINGVYSVPLPFKDNPTQLGDSFQVAKKRFSHLEKKLNASEDLRQGYNHAMLELIQNGYMSKSPDQISDGCYFIPHHLVSKPDSPSSKLRVVYDASTKTTSGKSLNDILYAGPKMYADLFSILLKFRLFPVALNGDITKMFLQIKLLPEYWKYQRILWRFSNKDNLEMFELKINFLRWCPGMGKVFLIKYWVCFGTPPQTVYSFKQIKCANHVLREESCLPF